MDIFIKLKKMNWIFYTPTFEYEELFEDWNSPWSGHKYFAYDLVRYIKPKVIVELGVLRGTSFFSMVQSIKDANLQTNIYGIDSWEGDKHTGKYDESILNLVKKIKKTYYKNLNIHLLKTYFDDAVKNFKDKSIDILHIDGLHTYKGVKHDFETWKRKVKKNGIILFHDTNEYKLDFGVYKLWKLLKKKYSNIDFLHSHGLGVLIKNDSKLEKFISLNEQWKAYYRTKTKEKRMQVKCEKLKHKLQETIMQSDLQIKSLKQEYNDKLNRQNQEYNNKLNLLNNNLNQNNSEINKLKSCISNQNTKIESLKKIQTEFEGFKQGSIWKILEKYRKVKKFIKTNLKKPLSKEMIIKKSFPDKRKQWEQEYFFKIYRETKKWLNSQKTNLTDIKKSYKLLKSLIYKPKISVILPVYNTEKEWFKRCIDSVRNQIYVNWELCISDDASTRKYIKDILNKYSKIDNRIKIIFRKRNGHICRSSNSALSLATGDYIAFLDHDDELTNNALLKIVEAINKNHNVDYIYSNEDKIELDNTRTEPTLKPTWSQDRIFSFMYTGHLSVYKKSIIDKVKGFKIGTQGSQDYDLLLRSLKHLHKIVHVDEILYHWRKTANSTALSLDAKPYAMKAGKNALTSYLKNKFRKKVKVTYTGKGYFNIKLPIKKKKIELFIKNNKHIKDILIKQITHNLNKHLVKVSFYNSIEELNDKFSVSKSDYSLICNQPQIKIINPEYIETFLGYLQFPKLAIIAPKIITSNNKIYSSGLILKKNSIYTPYFDKYDFSGYSNILETPTNFSGISSIFFAVDRLALYKNIKSFNDKLNSLFALEASLKMWQHNFRTALLPQLIIEVNKIDHEDKENIEYRKFKDNKLFKEFIPDKFFVNSFLINKLL